jgi:DNA-binding transcriptional MocR family regulator
MICFMTTSHPPLPLYEAVAQDIANLVRDGILRPGERVPSVRRLSAQKRVSISTVLQAYGVLENTGVIEARPQSGYYVRVHRAQPLEPVVSRPSALATFVGVNALVEMALSARKRPGIVPLGEACPSPELLPTAKLRRLLASVSARHAAALTTYAFPPGNEKLRRQIARHALDGGCSLHSDDIIITNGCMEALNLCLRAVAKAGDTIALESPTYFGLLQIIESLGMKALEIPTHPRDGISIEALELATRKRGVKACVVMANVSNPLGSVMPDEHKRRLVALLAERNIPLIEDDVYGDLHYGPIRPCTAKTFDRDGMVLLCSSFTKALAPGFRVGWVAPGRFQAQVEMVKFINSVATPEILQITLAEFLESGGYARHLRALRRHFAQQVQQTSQAVFDYFPSGTRVTRPQGGFVLWVELPAKCDALRLHREALAENIGLMPGPMFSASKKTYRNCIRLSCGYPWSGRIDQALLRLGELAKAQG